MVYQVWKIVKKKIKIFSMIYKDVLNHISFIHKIIKKKNEIP